MKDVTAFPLEAGKHTPAWRGVSSILRFIVGKVFPWQARKVMSVMDKRKEIINEYKRRKLSGGVYKVTNQTNGKYILGYAANLQSAQNRFQFAMTTGLTFDLKMQKDWEALGAQAFSFEILEELEQKSEQSQAAFLDDLKTLEQLWRAHFDESQAY